MATLDELIKKSGMNRTQISLAMGAKHSYIYQLEKGAFRITRHYADRMIEVLGELPDDIELSDRPYRRPAQRKERKDTTPFQCDEEETDIKPEDLDDIGVHNLLVGILKRTVADYKKHPRQRAEIIAFVESKWFGILYDVDPQKMINALEKGVKKNV